MRRARNGMPRRPVRYFVKPIMSALGLTIMVGAALMVAAVLILGGLGALSLTEVFMPVFAVFAGLYIIGVLLYIGGA